MVPPDTSSWRRFPYCVVPTLCVALTVSDTLNTSVPVVGDGMPSGMPQVQEGSGTIVVSPLTLPALPPVALPPPFTAPPTLEDPADDVAPPVALAPAVPGLPATLAAPAERGAIPALPGAPPRPAPPVAGFPEPPDSACEPACAVALPALPPPGKPREPDTDEGAKQKRVCSLNRGRGRLATDD